MPMMQNPNGTVTRLPYPGEPGYQGGAMPMGAMPMGGAPMGGAPMGAMPMDQMPIGGMAPPGLARPMNPMQQGMSGMLPPMRQRPQSIRMPAPPPRFPTPGRMDGTRDYPSRKKMGMGMEMGMGPGY